jgi:hypothetical protein
MASVASSFRGFSSVRKNLYEAHGAPSLGALVKQSYHVHEELPHRAAIVGLRAEKRGGGDWKIY